MITIKKLHKKYGKRKIQVFENNKMLGEITECCHWIALPRENHEIFRKIAMENLWWLLHSDNLDEDENEFEAWKEKCDKWNDPKNKAGLFNVPLNKIPDSLFFPGEYEIALNSINNI